jgi:hypothetical protein
MVNSVLLTGVTTTALANAGLLSVSKSLSLF